MSKRIIITISPKGETKIATEGFEGEECRTASAIFEKGLSGRTEHLTPEFYNGGGEVKETIEVTG